MSKHYMVVHEDTGYLTRLEEMGREITDEIREDAWTHSIECSDPSDCPGWQECPESHAGMDPDEEDSPAYDQYEDVEIHGVLHDWKSEYGWTVPFEGCPVVECAAFWGNDVDGKYDPNRPGRYLLDVKWDDQSVYLTVVEEVSE